MISFPLISRELRVQSRRRGTYDARILWGLSAIAVLGLFTWNFPGQSASGRNVLAAIHLCLLVMLFVLAPIGAADAISREKREGTLELLLLTELTATQIVLGKLAAHAIRLLYFGLMMLPFMMIPVLMGGVAMRDFLFSAAILLCITIAGLSAGLIISAVFVNLARRQAGL